MVTRKIGKLSASARLGPATFNRQNRTVNVVASSGSRGSRLDYDESLDVTKANLERLNSGRAPILNSHRNDGIENILGTVERAWVDGSEIMATLRFANTPNGNVALSMVEDGTLSSVSIGYVVKRYLDVTEDEDTRTHYRAIDWEILEISMVGVPFDRDAVVRSTPDEKFEVEIVKAEETARKDMSKTNETVLAERKRAQEINQIVRSAQLDTELADELIDRGVSADEARKEVLTKLAAKSAPAADVGVKPTTVELGRTHEHSRQAAMENAIANRISSSVTLDQGGREFAGLSLVRIAEKYLGGRKLGETDAMLAKRAMSTSDFPELLGNSANKALQAQFASIPKPYEVFARRDTLRDYKEHNLIRLSTFPSLQKRAEGGEFKYSSVSEQTEPVQLEDYGLILKFTKQMVVNDDLRGVARLMSEQSQAAARLEQRLVTNALITNSAMGDGKLLYHSDHGNIATETGDIGSNTAGDAFIKMGAQRSIDGLDSLGLRPRHVIVPPAMEFKARAFFATISPTKTSDTNPFQNVCEVLVDHNLADVTKYYWVADKSQIETVVLYNLEGQETPVVETRRRWEDSSLEIKVEHTATAKAMDWRGLVRGSTT